MSAKGHLQTCVAQDGMSASPLKADIATTTRNVGYGPPMDILVLPRMVQNYFQISGTGPTLFGRNGEGDPYHTDGEIYVATLVVDGEKRTEPPLTMPPPPLIALKDQIWHGIGSAVSQ